MLLNLAPDHLDRHGSFEAYARGEAARSSRTRATTTSPSRPTASASRTSAAARGACASAPGPRRSWRPRRAAVVGRRAARRADELAPARRPQPRATRWPPPRSRWPAGSPLDAVRDGAARRSPASSTASRRSRSLDGVAVRQRLQGDERRLDARGARELRRARAPDPRRPGQGPGLRAAARARCASAAPSVHLIGEDAGAAARRARPTGVALDDAATSSVRSARRARGRPPGRRRAALAGLRELRPVRRLRGPRAALQGVGRAGRRRLAARTDCAPRRSRPHATAPKARRRQAAQPLEYNILLTATLCLLAVGAVMVYSASSRTDAPAGPGRRDRVPRAST